MLSLETTDLLAEVRSQEKARDEHLEGVEQLVERFPGSWYSGCPGPQGQFDSENSAFEFISYEVPSLIWSNPRIRITSRRPRAQQMVAEAMQWGTQRWIQDSDLNTTLEELAVDFSFCWGIAHVSAVRRPETYEAEDPILTPQLSRISPLDFGWDHRAPTWRRSRMLWHRYRIDRDDLLRYARADKKLPEAKRSGWDFDAIDRLSAATQQEARRRWGFGVDQHDAPDRDQVEILEIFLPGHALPGEPGPDQGFNGTICTIGVPGGARDAGGEHIRPPRPFFGPRWGPYTIIGAYTVPDSPYPLSALCATAGHIEQATRISQAVDRQVEAYKRLLIVSALDGQLHQTIKDGKNDNVYRSAVANIDAVAREYEYGGTTQHSLAAEQRAILKRNRALGFEELQRGEITGEGTATEVSEAANAARTRQGYRKARYRDGVRRAIKSVCWYDFHSNEIVRPLGLEAAEALGFSEDEEAIFVGGNFDDGSGATFDDLALEIEPYSMERPNEVTMRQRGAVIAQVVQMLPALVMAGQAGADVRGILDAIGDSEGIQHLSQLFPGIESADPSVIQPTQAAPRYARDIGRIGLLPQGGGGRRATGAAPAKRGSLIEPEAFARFARAQ